MPATPEATKPANDIAELRGHLFDTMRALRDTKNPLDVKRAHAICDVAQQITDTARIELDMMKITKERVASDFLPPPDCETPPTSGQLPGHTRQTGNGTATVQSIGHGATVTRHTLR